MRRQIIANFLFANLNTSWSTKQNLTAMRANEYLKKNCLNLCLSSLCQLQSCQVTLDISRSPMDFQWTPFSPLTGRQLFHVFSGIMGVIFHRLIDGLVQERHNSSALTMELCLSFTNPSICAAEKNNAFLTNCGLVTPYGDMDLGQHWLR